MLRLCQKAEIAYNSTAHYCESPNLIAFCRAHAMERQEYQKFISLALEKRGFPRYKTKQKPLFLFNCKINLLNWLNYTNEKRILCRCLSIDRKLCATYELLLDNYNEDPDLIEKFRQQYDEIRKSIQGLSILIESIKNKKADTDGVSA